MDGFGSGMWGTWLFGALLVAGVVVLIVVIVRVAGGGIAHDQADAPRARGLGAPNSARQILDERYARGELTTAEYQERLAALGGDD